VPTIWGGSPTVTAIFPARIFKVLGGFFRPELSHIFSLNEPTSFGWMSRDGGRRPSCSLVTRRGGSRRTSPSCRSSSRRAGPKGTINPRPPTERRFAGCPNRHSIRSLDPRGGSLPGRSEGAESFSIFRNPRRLGPGQALTRVSAILLHGHGHTDHPSTGRCKAKWGGASEQNCTPRCVIPAVATVSAGRTIATKKAPRRSARPSFAIDALCSGDQSLRKAPLA
jgi:hypothetical protein